MRGRKVEGTLQFDFTKIMGIVCVVGLVVMVFGIVAIMCVSFAGAPPIIFVVYAGLMALVFMVVSLLPLPSPAPSPRRRRG